MLSLIELLNVLEVLCLLQVLNLIEVLCLLEVLNKLDVFTLLDVLVFTSLLNQSHNIFLHAFGCAAHQHPGAVQEVQGLQPRDKRPTPDLCGNDGESLQV